MSWVAERVERLKRIWENAHIIEDELWREIVQRVQEADRLGVGVYTESRQRVSRFQDELHPVSRFQDDAGEPTLFVRLSPTTSGARMQAGGVTLEVDVAGSGEVDVAGSGLSLKHEGKQVSIQEAGKLILEPFFFD
jgi:hypothetical protein